MDRRASAGNARAEGVGHMRGTASGSGLLFAALLLAACGGGSSSPSAMPTRAELQASLNTIVTTGVPGVLLRLGGPFGSEVLRSGVADLEGGRRTRTTDTFKIASVSKAFSGAVILGLVRDGRLGLDDTV